MHSGERNGGDAAHHWVIHQLRGLPSPAPGVLGERRAADRRRRPCWSVIYGSFSPRRRRPPRRRGDASYQVLDWHAAHLLAVAAGILLLCAGDALLTLALLSAGASEVNPVMAMIVGRDATVFAACKTALTGVGVVLLVMAARYRFMRVIRIDYVLYAMLSGYLALIGYELWLLHALGVQSIL
ncbi:MAG TPA: DUF5658 family protein [Steroidobacteraceae bacterium]|nr:DUF5658 family protein [Steroidobacteraceae bacterium]